MIRIAFIGAGGNCRRKHIPKLQAIEGVEVTGVRYARFTDAIHASLAADGAAVPIDNAV